MAQIDDDKTFVLNERLSQDCHILAELSFSRLLLMNNALIPWFILVPRVEVTEIHELLPPQQQKLMEEINLLSRFVQQTFSPDKLNVAAIGNIVRQMHVHIVGRREDDICWPGVVWGINQKSPYNQIQLNEILLALSAYLPPDTHFFNLTAKPD
ncbi:MAG: HIT family protein [Candidatus Thiodiazotropha sp. (ex Notomyrtea botanica)]|nr:HIT family protein [Candidatus Thiodiazotropha sp. (ex Notomyrtea botanica)]